MKHQRGILIFLTLALAYFARIVFVPLFLALFLAILLDPIVRTLMRWKFGRAEATIVVTVVFLCVTVATGWVLYHSVSGMHSTTEKIEQSTRTLGLGGPALDSDIQQVQVVENVPVWVQYVAGWVGSLYDLATVGIFVPLLLLYLLFDRDNLLESFNAIVGKYFYLPKLNLDLPKIIRAFVRGNIFTGILLIAVHALIFRLVGLGNWVPLAILSGFLNLIPLVGAPLALLLPFAQALIQFHEPGPFFVIGFGLVAMHMVSNNLVMPFFMSSRVNVNSVSLVFGLLFWGWLWGPIGFLLAIPMTALVKTFLESNSETFAISNLLAARPKHVIPWAHRFSKPLTTSESARPHPDNLKTVDIDEAEIRKLQARNNRET
jgi:AI-2 transport protein TqsA